MGTDVSAGEELSGWLDAGYRNLRAQLGPWVVVALAVLATGGVLVAMDLAVDLAAQSLGNRSGTATALLAAGQGMIVVAIQVLQTWVTLGAWRIALEQHAGRPVNVARLLSIEPRQLGQALLFLLMTLLALAVAVACVGGVAMLSIEAAVALGLTAGIAALLLAARLQFVYGLIVLDLGVLEAFEKSFQLTRGRTGRMLVFVLLVGLFTSLGLLACCVGLIVTLPFQWTAGAAALTDLVRHAEGGAAAAPLPHSPSR